MSSEEELKKVFLRNPENDEKFAQYLAKKFKLPVWMMRIEIWFYKF